TVNRCQAREKCPVVRSRRPAFSFRPTYDIDLLWAWQHRGFRGLGAGLRDLTTGHFSRAWQRFTVPEERDPYRTLSWIISLHPGTRPNIFWLLADNTDHRDPNPFPLPLAQQTLIRELDAVVEHGIHPSYLSMDRPDLFAAERARLYEILGRKPLHSRQHFLRFRLPDTYRHLQLSGIANDHTMGYADAIGWRAGTNLPFYWYDLEKEKVTGLLVHPFAAMDVTLKNYLQLPPLAAQMSVLNLAERLEPYGGDFALLWHNSSFAREYGWDGWKTMYAELVACLLKIE
ncbi:MAG: polysaccharide deacetylase family protein, partial [Bacteroidota bacterium]